MLTFLRAGVAGLASVMNFLQGFCSRFDRRKRSISDWGVPVNLGALVRVDLRRFDHRLEATSGATPVVDRKAQGRRERAQGDAPDPDRCVRTARVERVATVPRA